MYPLFRWLFLLLLSGPLYASALGVDLQGKNHQLSDYKGKWVVVNYWATWCPPCLEEIPELELFHTAHKDKDAVVLGMNMENIGEKRLRRFVDEQLISYPVISVKPARESPFGSIVGMPTSYLVNPEGQVVARQEGSLTAEDIETFIKNYKP